MPLNRHLILLNLLYVFGIGLNIVLLRFLSLYIEPLNNNGVRFLAGGIVLLLFVFWKYRSALNDILCSPKNLMIAITVGMMLAANMYFWLKGTKLTNAVTASLFGVLAMPFGVLFAALFYQDERQKIRHKAFWLGSFITILGSVGFVWQGQSLSLAESFWTGSLFLFLSIIIRNLQNLFVKAAKSLNMLAFSAITSLSMSFASLLISHQQGQLHTLSQTEIGLLLLLFGAGIYAVFAAMALAFYIIQEQGLITYQILELIIPVSTAIIAYLVLDEQISIIQTLFAILVIFGSSLALGIIKFQKLAKILRINIHR